MWSGLLKWMLKISSIAFSGRGKKLHGGCAKWTKKQQHCWNKWVSLLARGGCEEEKVKERKKMWPMTASTKLRHDTAARTVQTIGFPCTTVKATTESKETSPLLSSSAKNTFVQSALQMEINSVFPSLSKNTVQLYSIFPLYMCTHSSLLFRSAFLHCIFSSLD